MEMVGLGWRVEWKEVGGNGDMQGNKREENRNGKEVEEMGRVWIGARYGKAEVEVKGKTMSKVFK